MTNRNDIEFNPKQVMELYLHQQYELLSEKLLAILENFANINFLNLEIEVQHFVNVFIKNFLYVFTQPEYTLSDNHAIRFIEMNATISNLVAISSFKTTDTYLEILKPQPNNFVKILALYSARNTVKIAYQILFDAHPYFAGLWYSHFCELYRSALVNQEAYQNLIKHLEYDDDRLNNFYNISSVYFGVTDIDGSLDRKIKHKLNQSVKASRLFAEIHVNNRPLPKKIAIVTCVWFPGHSVYRNLSDFVESLQDDYELTLVHLGSIGNSLDIASFKNIRYVEYQHDFLYMDSIQNNDFMVVFYPDIGMSQESIILSNLRIAPIQVCGVGHSVSTFGSEIDYFISGADVEVSSGAESNYSERLVLLPGLGITNKEPNYQLKNNSKTRSEFIINCSWFSHKVNYPLLLILKEIVNQSKQEIMFRFFVGGVESILRNNGFIPFARDLESLLGKERFELIPSLPYGEYMALMEEGDICIDSYHFGGCNTIVDSLYLRKPTVTFEGTKWYNRIGSQMLRLVGLSELIATNPQEYINLILKLIHNDKYRVKIQDKLKQTDLNSTIFNVESKKYFKKAIDFLIENHEQLKAEDSRKPILIH